MIAHIAQQGKSATIGTDPGDDSGAGNAGGPRRYFDYALIQYIHQRREERINVGVAVYDPQTRELRVGIDPRSAAARVERIFPDVDRRGLEFFLGDMQSSLAKDQRLSEHAGQSPLVVLGESWQNILQFTSTRTYPAASLRAAVAGLQRRYLSVPEKAPPQLMGVQKAYENTRVAIRDVLQLDASLGQVQTLELPRVEFVMGRQVRMQPLDFPFYLYDRFVVDTLSFEHLNPKDTQREATLFIDKLRALKRFSLQRDVPFEPAASITIDSEREDLGLGMIAYIAASVELPPRAIVDADHAITVAEYIKERMAAA